MVDDFIEAISKPQLPGMHNPWSQSCVLEADPAGYVARRERLKRHLECPSPQLLLIGEAPGYQGCRYSGVAFTSERQLLAGTIPRMSDLQGQRITTSRLSRTEPSATIVWGALHEHGLAEHAVMFNAVPWHPEGPEGPESNRTPSPDEKALGASFLRMFLDLFEGVPVLALGGTASHSLNNIGVAHTKLRHPANGGATLFREGLAAFVESTRGN